ncbi:MAG TPA: ABC transporter permease [Aggregatilineales bacterium]|nr:ABC transporter permease [Aggregatilineales bacterium]
MFEQLGYDTRVIWACAVKDIRSALRTPASNLIIILVPINFLILELLFALSGALAPTAVVNNDPGPYAQQFVQAMQNAHSFRVIQTTAEEAQREITAGDIVAIVTIPASFDDDLTAGRQITIPVTLNNLNVDFTNDIRRAIPLTITSFYAKAFPGQVVVQMSEHDLYAQDTDYVPYLAVSVLVIAIMLGGMLQAGNNMAIEYERETIKELLLSPASRWAIQVGKVLGALMVTALSTTAVILVVVAILQVPPLNWLEVIAYALVMMPIFGAIGVLVGTLLRSRRAVIPLSLVLVLPLFFLSGAFGPTSFGGGATDVVAKLTPSYYGIAAFQHAFHGFTTTPTSTATNVLILFGFAVLAVLVSALMLRRTSVAH